MISVEIQTHRGITTAKAEIGGIDYQAKSANGAIQALFRLLPAETKPDSWEAIDAKTGMLCLSGPSWKRESKWTYIEGNDGIKRRRFAEFPRTGKPKERHKPTISHLTAIQSEARGRDDRYGSNA